MIRFFYIWYVLIKYALLYLAMRFGIYKKRNEKFLRQFFEEAGGSFIKFGQLLSLRVDFLPREYALEMLNLLDNVKAFPYHFVEERFIQELGAKPEKIFYDFQKEPFASASFGQVHAAKIDKSTIVVVKILRPGIEDDVKIDFLFVSLLAIIADIFFRVEAMPWREFAKEFKEWTLHELNYHIEADSTERIYKTQPADSNVVIPKIYHRYSTKRILVQDYIEGIPLSRVIRGLKDGRLTPQELLEMGIDIKKTPRILVQELMRQYFYQGYFHADPHPGNILLLQDDKIALLDFGITGEAAPNQKAFIEMLKAGAEFDFKKATYYLIGFAGSRLKQLIESAFPANVDEKYIDDFLKLLAERFSESVNGKIQQGIKDIGALKTDYAILSLQLLRETESYRIKLPKQMVVFSRAFSIIGFLAKELDYNFRITPEVQRFFAKHNEANFKHSDYTEYKRISRDKAIQELHDWLSFLVEKDPKMYHLVNKYIQKYNLLETHV